jgi:uroporphyrinogen-III synthase
MSYTVFIGRKLSSETQKWLVENNICFSEQPLIKVELSSPDLSFFNRIKNKNKNWVITSNWAAKWLVMYCSEIGFPASGSIYCLSEKQANMLSEISDEISISAEKNAKSLAELVSKNGHGKTNVYLRGNKSLNVFQSEIGKFNIRIVEVEVYRNIPLLQKISESFDAYLFFSPSGIESYMNAGNAIHSSAQIFAIGKTTGNFARTVFPNRVIESLVQEELGFVKFAISRIRKNRREPVKTEN